MDIQALFGARIMEDCETYLGLPMIGGKSKVDTFKCLQEKITKKVIGWKEKNYLKGKEGNNYQNGCPSHSYLHYGIFQNPKSLMRHDKLYTSQVLVGQTKDEKKIHWIN